MEFIPFSLFYSTTIQNQTNEYIKRLKDKIVNKLAR